MAKWYSGHGRQRSLEKVYPRTLFNLSLQIRMPLSYCCIFIRCFSRAMAIDRCCWRRASGVSLSGSAAWIDSCSSQEHRTANLTKYSISSMRSFLKFNVMTEIASEWKLIWLTQLNVYSSVSIRVVDIARDFVTRESIPLQTQYFESKNWWEEETVSSSARALLLPTNMAWNPFHKLLRHHRRGFTNAMLLRSLLRVLILGLCLLKIRRSRLNNTIDNRQVITSIFHSFVISVLRILQIEWNMRQLMNWKELMAEILSREVMPSLCHHQKVSGEAVPSSHFRSSMSSPSAAYPNIPNALMYALTDNSIVLFL